MSLTAKQPAYEGDEALDRLLVEAGSGTDARAVRELLTGVLAAPVPEDPDAWMILVAPAPSEGLRSQLRALKAEMESAQDSTVQPDAAARLAELRAELAAQGLDGFVVTHADEHQGEYLPPRAERLAWLTGFTGSAGAAVVLRDKAALFVDGRYTLQAEAQVEAALYEQQHLIDAPPQRWIESNLGAGQKLGYDPWLHTEDQVKRLRAAAEKAGGTLVPCAENPVDKIWHDQRPPPLAPIVAQEIAFCGKPAAEKRAEIAEALAKAGADAAVLTQPDSIAWLLNVRGGDVSHTPLPLSFAIVHADSQVQWFVDRRKLVPGLDEHLGNAVSIAAPQDLGPALEILGRAEARVLADPTTAAAWVFERLESATIVRAADPCQLPKACKNQAELDGMRRAHERDGAALSRFLAWLSVEAPQRADDGTKPLTEIEAAERLIAFRRQGEHFRDLSFTTISGAGPNGAIVHYNVNDETNRPLEPGQLYLVDSGAQYLDGTTDVTRTVAIGEPSREMRDRFTRVLKGHIAIATARFPSGTTGSQLDTLARLPLWQVGLDYDHGTGHGVGSYLGVHEGPQRVSKLPNRTALKPGMVVSNEPGYYKTGAYGIRIENLVTVVESPKQAGEERDMLAFETLTLAPIDLKLVEPSLLTAEERAWLDAYHTKLREALTPLVDDETRGWLDRATRPLGSDH